MMSNSEFEILKRKEIYQLLEGSGPVRIEHNGIEYGMPYYSANDLGNICVRFGTPCGGCGSRWNYVEVLLDSAIQNNRCDEVLRYFFSFERFDNLRDLPTREEIREVYRSIVKETIKYINHIIKMTQRELVFVNSHFCIVAAGTSPEIETPQLNAFSIPYVQGLRERCRDDFFAGNFDSVITKSRTMMEEVLVTILEDNNVQDNAKGDLIKQYNQVKSIYGMQQSKEYDTRVNSLLNGLERIVQAIAEMRNANSDAHGVGSRRINVRECEARLIMNSAITFCEYIISAYDRKMAV